jgi:transposase
MEEHDVELIADQPFELALERVCAIDVAKDAGKVCLRLPARSKGGRRVSKVWDVAATTRAVTDLADVLLSERVEKITVESTSDYWRIWFYVLESAGLSVQLVNARDVKNVPGRPKTDRLDAVWLAKLTERGMLRPSFVPPAPVRQMRDYTRLRVDLTRERTRYWQRLEKLLEDALIKVSSVASSVTTMSVREMLEALIAGQRDPHILADMARKQMRHKHDRLVEALTGRFDEHHAEICRILLDQIDALTRQIDHLTGRIDELCATLPSASPPTTGGSPGGDGKPAADAVTRLDEITGIGRATAQTILAEIGPDMTVFPTAGHLVSWAKLSPRAIQSGNRSRSGRTGRGNPYLKGALGEAAATAARTNTFLGARYRRLVKRRGKMKALVAVARSILVIVYELLADPTARYHDPGADYYEHRINTAKRARQLTAQLETLGYTVTLTSAAA